MASCHTAPAQRYTCTYFGSVAINIGRDSDISFRAQVSGSHTRAVLMLIRGSASGHILLLLDYHIDKVCMVTNARTASAVSKARKKANFLELRFVTWCKLALRMTAGKNC